MIPGRRKEPRNSRRRLGSVAIEYGLVLPALLLFVLGLMDGGRLLWTYATLYRASEAAARCAAVDAVRCGTATDTRDFAVSQAFGLTVDATAFTVSQPACGMQVEGQYDFVFIIPWAARGTITLETTACYPK
jgi:Flp pilus assembly protein TadG